MFQHYGLTEPTRPSAQPVPDAGCTHGSAARAQGPRAGAVGAARSAPERAECPQWKTSGVELQSLLPEEVNSLSSAAAGYTTIQ